MRMWGTAHRLRRGPELLRDEAGQALVELAVSATLLTAVVLGAAELARAVYAAIEVSSAASAAVEYGAQSSTNAADTSGMQSAAQKEAGDVTLGTTTPSLTYTCSDGSSAGSPPSCATSALETVLTVKTQITFDPLIHIPGLPKTYTIYGQAVQKVLQ